MEWRSATLKLDSKLGIFVLLLRWVSGASVLDGFSASGYVVHD